MACYPTGRVVDLGFFTSSASAVVLQTQTVHGTTIANMSVSSRAPNGIEGGKTIPSGQGVLSCGCTMGALWATLGEGYQYRPYTYANETSCIAHYVSEISTFRI